MIKSILRILATTFMINLIFSSTFPMQQSQIQQSKWWIAPAVGITTATIFSFGLLQAHAWYKKRNAQKKAMQPLVTITHVEIKKHAENQSQRRTIKQLKKESLNTTLLLFDVNSMLRPQTDEIEGTNFVFATQDRTEQKKENTDLVGSIKENISKLNLPQHHEIYSCLQELERHIQNESHKFNCNYTAIMASDSAHSVLQARYKRHCCPDLKPHAEQLEKIAQSMLTRQQDQLKAHFAQLRIKAKERARAKFEFENLG